MPPPQGEHCQEDIDECLLGPAVHQCGRDSRCVNRFEAILIKSVLQNIWQQILNCSIRAKALNFVVTSPDDVVLVMTSSGPRTGDVLPAFLVYILIQHSLR